MPHDSSAFAADPELIETLKTKSKPVSTGSNRVLFRQGDPPFGIFILETGAAVATMKAEDVVVMQVQIEAGAILGLPATLGEVPYSLTADVMEGSAVSFLPKQDFTQLIQSSPLLSFKVLQILASQVRLARRALSHL